jgi:hypothetical protein
MARTIRLLLALAALGGTASSAAFAQAPNAAPAPDGTPAFDPLPGLPHPPDRPRSLLEPAPPAAPYACAPLPGPYFELDPQFDLPELPQPGWFLSAEMALEGVHLKNNVFGTVQVGARPPDFLVLPSASLDLAVAPRIEAGYRLPSGFGEFLAGYRFLAAQGTEQTVAGPDALAQFRTRLDLNQIDAVYSSREISLWPHWDMRWRFGLRLAYVYFDSRSDEPLDAAAAGSGVFERRTTNSYWGLGPVAGVEVSRRLEGAGVSLGGRLEVGTLLGRIRQGFFETATALGPDGRPLAGEAHTSGSQQVPIVNVQLGVNWEPPAWRDVRLFGGYQFEHWWQVGSNGNTATSGTLTDQGLVLRGEIDF